MLRAPNSRRERILVYGRSNSGKSSTWLSVASWAADTEAEVTVHLGDTDAAWDAMRPEDGSLDHIVEVSPLDINDFREWIVWAKKVKENVKADDWVVVDMVDKAWLGAQTYYWDQVSSGDMLADIYLKNQLANASEGKEGEFMGGAYGANWSIINKFYGAFFQQIINMPCHVLCVTPAAEVRKEYDKPEVINQYKVGWKPAGQKDLAHGFHSLIFAAETPRNWVYTTVRERGPIGGGRELMKGVEVVDFVQTYLMKIGGWRP